ncbi:geraniol 8-hydroxylase [Lolium perenne]|uniref:geraniol 8-hydroxylase n=1 Tax=Lolium perenne TaxID=4522 RepID=UPI0021EA1EDB|nr:flavonoid 3'-monooxygenase CYP75B137-like [Lolium perenne]
MSTTSVPYIFRQAGAGRSLPGRDKRRIPALGGPRPPAAIPTNAYRENHRLAHISSRDSPRTVATRLSLSQCVASTTAAIMDAATTTTLLYGALLAAAFLYVAALRRRRGGGEGSLPPGPKGLPLLGSLLSLDPDLHTYFAGLAARYGPIFSIRLGSKLGIVITSPALAREVLRENDLVFSSRDIPDAARSISYGGGQNIVWNPVGPTWRLLRRVCVREMLSPAGLENVHGLRRREFRATLAHLHAAAAAGKSVDVGAQLFLTTMNVITGTLWGGNIGTESERTAVGKEFRELVAEITEMLGAPNVSDFFPSLTRFDLQGIRKKSDVLKTRFDEIFARIIEQRVKTEQAGGETSEDFLEYMLKMEKEGGDGKASFTMTNVKALLMDMVVGGTETTSNTVEWAMAEMLQNRSILRKVQEELDAVVGVDGVVEESHLPQLHYLQLVVKETLRLHPALPLMVPHCPSEDTTVGGYRVPAGSRVFVNAWAIMRDPEAWEDPAKFVPERFAASKDSVDGRKVDFTGSELDYMPFGSGRRICAGIAMAERMTAYSIAMLLQAFDWELPEGAALDLTEKFGIVMKKATPLVAVPTPRLSRPELYSA